MATTTAKTQAKKTTQAAKRTSAEAATTAQQAERTAQTVVSDSVYAAVGAGDSAVAALRSLPRRVETLRTEVTEAPARARSLVTETPAHLRSRVEDLRSDALEEFDGLAKRGRGVVASVTRNKATQRALDQTKAARSQLKAAVTSVRKSVGASAEAVDTAAEKVGQEPDAASSQS